MPRLLAAIGLASVALLGCAERSLSELPPVPGNVLKLTIPVKLNRNIDILFVIDDSGSMGEEQASLARNFPAFVNVLNTIPGGLPDVHIGVVSSNVGTGGVNIGGCSSATLPEGDDGNLWVREMDESACGAGAAHFAFEGAIFQRMPALWAETVTLMAHRVSRVPRHNLTLYGASARWPKRARDGRAPVLACGRPLL